MQKRGLIAGAIYRDGVNKIDLGRFRGSGSKENR